MAIDNRVDVAAAKDYMIRRGERFYNTETISAISVKCDNSDPNDDVCGYVGVMEDGVIWHPIILGKENISADLVISASAPGKEYIPPNTDITPPMITDDSEEWILVFPRSH